MKSKKSSFVCITLALILLFLGMCSQIKRADSILASFQQIISEPDFADSQRIALETESIDKAEIDSSYIGNCTSKLITGLRDTFEEVRRGHGRIGLKSQVEFLCMEGILQIFVSFYTVSAAMCFKIQGSDITILNYIHNQDGEK